MLFLNFNQKYTREHCHISHDPPRVPHFSHNSSACPSGLVHIQDAKGRVAGCSDFVLFANYPIKKFPFLT